MKKKYCISDDVVGSFAHVVKKYPNRVALKYKDKVYTYKELDDLTDTIACNLMKFQLKKGSVVAIHLEQNADYIMCILGILKCGCTYLPLKSIYPLERISSMLSYSQTEAVITYDKLLLKDENNILFNDLLKEQEQMDKHHISSVMDDLAYIIFTSGSTGKPKGIGIQHKGIINLVNSLKLYLLESDEQIQRVALLSSFVFDMSVAQIFFSLLTGQVLDIIPDDVKESAFELASFLSQRYIDNLDITPIHLNLLIEFYKETKQNYRVPSKVISAGEALPLQTAKCFFETKLLKDSTLFNCYGPSETCVYVTVLSLTSNSVKNMEQMTIGVPIRNTSVYILDQNLNLCKEEEQGEIYLAGDGVGIGYIGDTELTMKCFLPDLQETDKKMYRTGDLGCLTKAGEIYYAGRVDEQIKIRGYRVELGEVEYHLNALFEIKQSRVIVIDNKIGKFIVGYYISDKQLDLEYFENNLKKILPIYMIPSYFVPVKQFELTVSRKLDKTKLPDYKIHALKKNALVELEDIERNDSKVQQMLLSMCRNVLMNKKVEIKDDFFTIGGNSILVMSLNSAIYRKWGIHLKISEFYSHSLIYEIAEIIEKKLNENRTTVESISYASPEVVSTLITPFQKLCIYEEKKANQKRNKYKFCNCPTFNIMKVIKAEEYLHPEQLKQAVQKVIWNEKVFQIIFEKNSDGMFEMKWGDLTFDSFYYKKCEDANDYNALKSFGNDFIMNQLPLIEFFLFEDANKEQTFLINVNHLIFDYYSIFILVDEILSAYYGVDTEFKQLNFMEHIDRINKKDKQEEYKFWLNYYKDRPMSKGLPFDKDGNTKRFHNILFYEKRLSIKDNHLIRLRNFCKEQDITEYIFSYGCFCLLLHYYSNESDIIVGTYLNSRNQDNYEEMHMIGLLASIVGIRSQINLNMTIQSYFAELKKNIDNIKGYLCVEHNELYGIMDEKEIIKGSLVNITFNYIIEGSRYISNCDKIVSIYEVGEEPEILPIDVKVFESPDEILYKFKYAESLFTESRIEEFLNILFLINHIAMTNAEQKIEELFSKLIN